MVWEGSFFFVRRSFRRIASVYVCVVTSHFAKEGHNCIIGLLLGEREEEEGKGKGDGPPGGRGAAAAAVPPSFVGKGAGLITFPQPTRRGLALLSRVDETRALTRLDRRNTVSVAARLRCEHSTEVRGEGEEIGPMCLVGSLEKRTGLLKGDGGG